MMPQTKLVSLDAPAKQPMVKPFEMNAQEPTKK